jgi:hypothetical protein
MSPTPHELAHYLYPQSETLHTHSLGPDSFRVDRELLVLCMPWSNLQRVCIWLSQVQCDGNRPPACESGVQSVQEKDTAQSCVRVELLQEQELKLATLFGSVLPWGSVKQVME